MTPHLGAVPVMVFKDKNSGALDPVLLVEVMLNSLPYYVSGPAFGFVDGTLMN